ncbi:MAG: amylo-alpha-1,6-glucosidase, partial [Candidatus Eisenbacteria bacterium]
MGRPDVRGAGTGIEIGDGDAALVVAGAPRLGREVLSDFERASRLEWLCTNGRGGYAAGSAVGAATRRYHGLLVSAVLAPTDRVVTVTHVEETVQVDGAPVPLSSHQWPGAVAPQGHVHLEFFSLGRRPTWRWRVGPLVLEKSIFMVQGRNTSLVEYRHLDGPACELDLRPFVVQRDHHLLTRESRAFRTTADVVDGRVRVRPAIDLPALWLSASAGRFLPWPVWYQNFEYAFEVERGLDFREDAMSPGPFAVALEPGGRFVLALSTEDEETSALPPAGAALERWSDAAWEAELARLAEVEEGPRRARALRGPGVATTGAGEERLPPESLALLARAADQFLVEGVHGPTVIAGYPWFTDWGRDSMIALPGLLLATGRLEVGRGILDTFARFVAGGLLPNRFPEGASGQPEYGTIDAALWFAVAGDAYLELSDDEAFLAAVLVPALEAILEGYSAGTRYGIRAAADGLIEGGEDGLALTWMDAKIDGRAVTPRRGKAVEINALWHNAWATRARWAARLGDAKAARAASERAAAIRAAFATAFWSPSLGWLADVVDTLGPDPALRPNQVYALSLPTPVIDGPLAARVLDALEKSLLTPYGLRTLAPGASGYLPVYTGAPAVRDEGYHNGVVWPFLLGPYLTAHFRVRGRTAATRAQARRMVEPLLHHLGHDGCLGSISEVFDGEPPFTARGCFAQAWSVAELARVWIEEDL